jgi:glutathione S-transferase
MTAVNLPATLSALSRNLFYSAWFCPYAQRVWCTLNELNIKYELVESLEIDPQTNEYIKNEELLKYNPRGLVPTIARISTGKVDEAIEMILDEDELKARVAVYKNSIDVMKKIYEGYLDKEDDDGIMKPDKTGRKAPFLPHLVAQAKVLDERLCSPFYTILMKPEEEGISAWETMTNYYLPFFTNSLSYENDVISFYQCPYCDGERPSIVDFAVFPFIHRLYILEHYKGLTLPSTTKDEIEMKTKILDWCKRMEERPSVKQTLADREKLIPIYARYADGTAKSQVADAVRQGIDAHFV